MAPTKGTVTISRNNAQKIKTALPGMLSDYAVVFDIETTGLQRWDEIVSIAAKSPVSMAGMQTFIMPRRPQQLLKKNQKGICAFDINGIHPDHLAGSPSFEEAYPQIRKALEGKHWICWNADFDVEFLDNICDRRDVARIPRAGVYCAMKLLSPLAGLRGQGRGKIERVVISNMAEDRARWQKLSRLAKRMEIDARQAHDAAGDVDMTIAIIQWAAEKLKNLPLPPDMRRAPSHKKRRAPTRETRTDIPRKMKPVPLPPLREANMPPIPSKKRGCFPTAILLTTVAAVCLQIIMG